MPLLEWSLWLAGFVAIPVPVLAVVMCTAMKPRSLFLRLGTSRTLRHWAVVLVVFCSALAGAWTWSAVYAKYRIAARAAAEPSPEVQ